MACETIVPSLPAVCRRGRHSRCCRCSLVAVPQRLGAIPISLLTFKTHDQYRAAYGGHVTCRGALTMPACQWLWLITFLLFLPTGNLFSITAVLTYHINGDDVVPPRAGVAAYILGVSSPLSPFAVARHSPTIPMLSLSTAAYVLVFEPLTTNAHWPAAHLFLLVPCSVAEIRRTTPRYGGDDACVVTGQSGACLLRHAVPE